MEYDYDVKDSQDDAFVDTSLNYTKLRSSVVPRTALTARRAASEEKRSEKKSIQPMSG